MKLREQGEANRKKKAGQQKKSIVDVYRGCQYSLYRQRDFSLILTANSELPNRLLLQVCFPSLLNSSTAH